MMKLSEKEMLIKLIQGDVLSFEKIFKIYNRKIYAFSLRYLKNKEDAEGIVQEVFMKLWENSSKLKKDSNLNAWLYTVTFNAIRKKFRKLSTERKHVDNYSELIEKKQDEYSEILYSELLEKSSGFIKKLPAQQRKVILLRQEKGLTAEEMAKELNLSRKTIENHLNRARTFLKKAMTQEGLLP